MSEKPLLLSSAKTGVLVEEHPAYKKWFPFALVVGVFVVVVGAADVTTRFAHAFLGNDAAMLAFAPAVTLVNQPVVSVATNTSTTTVGIIPAQLTIPAIGVNAVVEQVGKNKDGSMGTPSRFDTVAWYAPGSRPGGPGNAVIDGHVNNALTTAGVFEHLSDVALGDTIEVSDKSGKTLTYIVKDVEEYPADTAPASSIFATTGPSRLVLITCDGTWIESQRSFDKRLVVYANLK